jgi:hypothetical protein
MRLSSENFFERSIAMARRKHARWLLNRDGTGNLWLPNTSHSMSSSRSIRKLDLTETRVVSGRLITAASLALGNHPKPAIVCSQNLVGL